MRPAILILGLSLTGTIARGEPVDRQPVPAGVPSTARPQGFAADTGSLAILRSYLRGRSAWVGSAPAVKLCWPLSEAADVDESEFADLVENREISGLKVGCTQPADDDGGPTLPLFRIEVNGDTAIVESGGSTRGCTAFSERSRLVLGPPLPDGEGPEWELRSITFSAEGGSECVTITPRPGGG